MLNQQLARRRLLLGCACSVFGARAFAQGSYPSKAVTITVGFPPGGGSDLIARLLAGKLSQKLDRSVVVENQPGAGGSLSAEYVLKQPADGYSLLLAAASYTVNPSVYRLPFDAIRDITPIALLARGPFVVAVNQTVPVKSLQELLLLARRAPRTLSYASSGDGSIVHMATKYLLDLARVQIMHTPYPGTFPALKGTASGHTQLILGSVGSTLPFVESGKLRPIAVTTQMRFPGLPDVPTVAESGYPSYEVTNWHGLLAPSGLPRDIQLKLHGAVQAVMHDRTMEQTLAVDGLLPAAGSPEYFGNLLESEVARWAIVAKGREAKVHKSYSATR